MNLLSLITAPATAPVTLDECKADLRIQHTAEDDLISDLILAATDYCQEVVGKKLVSQVWEYSLPRPDSCGKIWLPLGDAISIDEIRYYDADNVEQVLVVDDFQLYTFEDSAFLQPSADVNWPNLYRRLDAITVRFTVGYGDSSLVPAGIKRAIRLLVAHWYENRMAVTVGVTSQQVPMGVEALLSTHRIGWVA